MHGMGKAVILTSNITISNNPIYIMWFFNNLMIQLIPIRKRLICVCRQTFWVGGKFFGLIRPGKEGLHKMEVKLYVGNLSFSTTEEQVRTLFAQAGTVVSVELIKDRDTGQSKGFCFVTMGAQAEAAEAIKKFNDYMLDDRALKVNTARPKEDSGRGGFGGPRGGAGGYGRKPGAGGDRNRGGGGGQRRY
jgi:cold-inducible RNA-binding protein